MGSFSQRKQERFPVNFSVRFGAAREFVQEYAENLSTGGIFVRGAHRLEMGEQMIIELDLPGYDTFIVTAEVAHIITPEESTESGRIAGAGLQIRNIPDGFDAAMRDYLLRLGKRRDSTLLVADDGIRGLFKEAGFKVRALPPPTALKAVIDSVELPVIGVIVPSELYEHYASSADAIGRKDFVHIIDGENTFDDLLRALDTVLKALVRDSQVPDPYV